MRNYSGNWISMFVYIHFWNLDMGDKVRYHTLKYLSHFVIEDLRHFIIKNRRNLS